MFRSAIKEHQHHGYGHNGSVKIRRGYEFEDAFKNFYKKSMNGRIKVVFINQHGL